VTNARKTLDLLRTYESPNITFLDDDGSWPIVWERAQGVHVWDADGKKYLDLTAAFGVAAAGHANPRVVKAGQQQMKTLLHAMGDVHPHKMKAQLARELSRITFERWKGKSKVQGPKSKVNGGKTIFCNSGFEAVEAALKTAILATGRKNVIAFERAYHGLGYGALNITHREHFRGSFRPQLREFAEFLSFPAMSDELAKTESAIGKLLQKKDIGAILVEPIQARGGIHIPPPEFLPMLRRVCDEHGALLILDEIYTGFGRTGKWFACEHSPDGIGVVPDLICLGKALSGGFPISACVGRADLMDKTWPRSTGEAIHTSTFLGHPVGCAMALAEIEEIRKNNLVECSARLGKFLLNKLETEIGKLGLKKITVFVRGIGLMVGVELNKTDQSPATEESLHIIKALLHRGFIFLPEGKHANIISFTPPLVISENQLDASVSALTCLLRKM
jgi:4-aminobutyrate aminotransferase-like enzyme